MPVLLLLLAGVLAAYAQDQPKPFTPPKLRGQSGERARQILAAPKDPSSSYASPHEAALAALKSANAAAALFQNDKAFTLLLLGARRDPAFGLVVFDLGALCDRQERWDDAAKFYAQVANVNADPDLLKRASEAAQRVQLRQTLLASDEGRQRLEYENALVDAFDRRADAPVALDAVNGLNKRASGRWEGPALAALLEADLGRWEESLKSIESAFHLAPADRRAGLEKAAGIARREARYQELIQKADAALDSRDYPNAAGIYSEAWDLVPEKTTVGLSACVAFLMSDQVGPAAQCLGRLRQSGTPDEAIRATAMLHELIPVSQEAKRLEKIDFENQSSPGKPAVSPSALMAQTAGEIVTSAMMLAARAAPALVEDNTKFIPVADSDLTAQAALYASTDSIFDIYRKTAGAAPAADTGAPPVPAASTPSGKAAEPENKPAEVSKPVLPKTKPISEYRTPGGSIGLPPLAPQFEKTNPTEFVR